MPSGQVNTQRRAWLRSATVRWLPAAVAFAAFPVRSVTAAEPAATPAVNLGRIERWALMPSRHVAPRHVDIWLPPGLQSGERANVVYMHDGQMVFDPRTTWNRQAWRAHEAVALLMQQGRLPPTIVVGIWNNQPERYAEYFPQRALGLAPEGERQAYIAQECNGKPKADAYLRFIVEELKPQIDARFPTHPGAEHTAVVGASMGGLISLYAACEYPQVFGRVGALSTHWLGRGADRGLEGVRNAALPMAVLQYLQQHLPSPATHRLWVDRGDDALDSLYAPGLALAAELLRDRGYAPAQGTARVFAGTGHNETDWSRRLGDVLEFLFSPPRPVSS